MTDPWPLDPADPLSALECSQSGPVPKPARDVALYGVQGARRIAAKQDIRFWRSMIRDIIGCLKICQNYPDDPSFKARKVHLLNTLADYRARRRPALRKLIAASRGRRRRRVA